MSCSTRSSCRASPPTRPVHARRRRVHRQRVLPLRGHRDQAAGASSSHGASTRRSRSWPRTARCARRRFASTSRGARPRARSPRSPTSGCAARCTRQRLELLEGYDLGLGGALGPDAGFLNWVEGAVRVDDLDAAILRRGDGLRRATVPTTRRSRLVAAPRRGCAARDRQRGRREAPPAARGDERDR